uniref:M48 family metallopeptidase n=1 Tax=Eubacterium cellulosolvens TaxID=29322 RepID=UPI00048756B4|nr:SprT family zinc-dependent metalloprotease [[Eubacterium] cellulosolvens]
MNTEYEIIRSSRKTLALQMKSEGQLIVRAPYRTADREIRRFVDQNSDWIQKHRALIEQRRKKEAQNPPPAITRETLHRLAALAVETIPPRVAYYADIIGVSYGRITIRSQKTRWGSCSAKGNLNFNCLLMLTPPDVQNYVIIHELCHRKQMNHSHAFWKEVSQVMPDYRKQRSWLKENGGALIRSMLSQTDT